MGTNQKRIVIEFGSNTAKILYSKDGHSQSISLPLRLQAALDDELILSDEAMGEIIELIESSLRDFGSKAEYTLLGTEALRRAKNAEKLIKLIKQRFSLNLNILSPSEEASAALKAIYNISSPFGAILAFDIGGASTELIAGKDGKMKDFISYPFGALKLANKFISQYPASKEELQALEDYLLEEMPKLPFAIQPLYGCGGSVNTCARVAIFHQNPLIGEIEIEGFVLSHKELLRQKKLYQNRDTEEIAQIKGMDPKRADIILPAVMIILRILELCALESFVCSSAGIRHAFV